MAAPKKPTIEAYTELQQAYDYFNQTLFEGDLPGDESRLLWYVFIGWNTLNTGSWNGSRLAALYACEKSP